MNSTALIPLPATYPSYQLICIPLLIAYAGVFVMISNHFVFKPKLELFFSEGRLSSVVGQQLLVDFLTNLPVLTLMFNQILLVSSDYGVSILVIGDSYWSGLCLGIVSWKYAAWEEKDSNIMLIKNVICLSLIYSIISAHYLSNTFLISLGASLIAIYFISLVINLYEVNFVRFIQGLLNDQDQNQHQISYSHKSLRPSPHFLAINFPVTKMEIKEQAQTFTSKQRSIKLKTRATVSQKLLQICSAVHLSQQQMAEHLKKDVKNYYGMLNGTINSKYKRAQLDFKQTSESFEQGSNLAVTGSEGEASQFSILFVIFPVKIFESSKIMSIIFSIFMNLGLGFALSYGLQVSQSLPYGDYFQFVYAAFLVPLIPAIGKRQYLNSMVASSMWKYGLGGVMLTIECAANGSFSWAHNNILKWITFPVLIQLSLVTAIILSPRLSHFPILLAFLIAFIAQIAITYKLN